MIHYLNSKLDFLQLTKHKGLNLSTTPFYYILPSKAKYSFQEALNIISIQVHWLMKYWTLKLYAIYSGSLDRKLGVFKITSRNIRIRIFICCRWFYRGEKQANKQNKETQNNTWTEQYTFHD